jgi:hypothetical protein
MDRRGRGHIWTDGAEDMRTDGAEATWTDGAEDMRTKDPGHNG